MRRAPVTFLRLAFGGLFFASLLAVTGCGKEEKSAEKGKVDPALAAVVSGISGGMQSAEGPIRVTFVNPVADSAQVNNQAKKNPFEFTPGIEGKAVWADPQTLEFRPAARLSRGMAYKVVLRLDRILEVPEKLRRYEFGFTVLNQDFNRDIHGIEMMDENEIGWQRLGGLLRLADAEEGAEVEKMLTASQDGRDLPVIWKHRSDRREHPFQVDSLRRGETTSRVILAWDGKPVGVNRRHVDTVAVPAIGEFTVLDVSAATDGERFLGVRFSDPLKKDQDLRGLVEVEEQGGLRFQVEGNVVKVYSTNEWHGGRVVKVNAGIRNIFGKVLGNPGSWNVAFEEIKPGVRFVGKGVIMPGQGNLVLPFEAVNLRAVTVKVIRIHAGNVPQFLQINSLEGDQELRRVGRPVLKKAVALNPTASMRQRWARYALDLTELARKDAQPGTMYRISLSFRKSQSTYPCGDVDTTEAGDPNLIGVDKDDFDDPSWDGGSQYHYGSDYENYEEGEDYDWNERENPCTPSYFRYERSASRNFLPSDIGLMAKMGRPGKLYVIATDLLTAKPMPETEVEALSFQHQVLGRGRTDGDGFAEIDLAAKAFLVRATKGQQRGYLKVEDGAALQLGNFDVGGEAVQEGLKGFLFGERGVWRPGDSLYLTLILEDKLKRLPAGHPVTFELRNPAGQVVRTLTRASETGFYRFATDTDPDAPTGEWLARVKAGPAVIEERLKIETVMPNRLKIKVDFTPKPLVATEPIQGALDVSWLSGAVARELEAEVEMTMVDAPQGFPGFETYGFQDPARSFKAETQTLWTGSLDGSGHAEFSKQVQVAGQAPGPLRANFRTRVIEGGGAFSVDRWSEPFHPYPAYVGIKLPLEGRGYEALFIDSTHKVKFAAVGPAGRRLAKRRVEVKIFKAGWSWWWDRDNEGTSYLRNEHKTKVRHDTVIIKDGVGEWSFSIKHPDYGRYVIRACDLDVKGDGHCSGSSFYMDWPYSYGNDDRKEPGGGAAIVALRTDKPRYAVGEKVKLTLPSPRGGRALVSIEKGPSIHRRYWIDLKEKGETVHEFEADEGMAPNAYVYVALLQPHGQTENDLPIRMYNVVPILVEDPGTRLKPKVKAEPGVFRPGEKATIAVSEEGGKGMEYVVAVVDEGLLDLTRFPTPDPWNRFYAREALGIRTWDLYDFVAGAYGSRLERILSIGGDEGGIVAADGRKGNRFPPMVKFLGPFSLDKGKTARHDIDVPQYVGAVRVMVVAGRGGAYGTAEQSVFVRKPLMVLGTMPRILAPDETFQLPVSVFAMEKHVKSVEVEVTATGPVKVVGERKRKLALAAPTDELINFALETPQAVGWAKILIKAVSGNERAEQTMDILVRNPNDKVTDVVPYLLPPGGTWSHDFALAGVQGTNQATLELSRVPPIDMGRHLGFLIQYPYGCVEQTTSGAFPQLHLDALTDLTAAQKQATEFNVKAGIQRLRQFQTSSGGFGYWPGDSDPNDWASSYAGHFLVEAEKKGYSIPAGMLDQWKRFQRASAQAWNGSRHDNRDLHTQSYRLYTLALAGVPDMGSMNRLKESLNTSAAVRWQLGGAYHLAGQAEVAKSLVQGTAEVQPYIEMNGTFGSDLRDRAMMLEVLSIMGQGAEATPLMQAVANDLSRGSWLGTQTTAYALLAMAKYSGKILDRSQTLVYRYSINGSGQDGTFAAPIHSVALPIRETGQNQLTVRNDGKSNLYARLIVAGIPPLGQGIAAGNSLHLSVVYKDKAGEVFDISRIVQGTDFRAEVTVSHGGDRGHLEQLALTALFPSGWEIRNTRMDRIAAPGGKSEGRFAYQDFRDDRVHTFFDLQASEQRVYSFHLNAAYLGRFHLPQIKAEAMYDADVNARTAGGTVEVVTGEGE